ncbi:thioredoxin family protein [Fibrella forsythiae]|uniref:Thioredoxin family protein n=1 Tax=Fibrella forsythiae TaxID=2817061 RepID=A0ABS3JQJ5_9BACT|nr:thioredoxin family protein [Fibrella forsythiae]MBO0952272.1 thioredoxin family protein [Fibrella forsythiae]
MKNLIHYLRLVVWLAFFSITFGACMNRPASVQFFSGSWKELLTEARKQNKPIFVEVHTVWCGPCRQMEKQAFPNSEVAAAFNAKFINYQIDMEQGEGPMLRKEYAIMAVPTLLYFSPDGILIHRSKGYDDIAGLLADADEAIKAAKAPSKLSELEAKYASGRRDTPFLRTYLIQRAETGQPHPEALATYLSQIPQTDWSSAETIVLIAKHNQVASSSSFEWLLAYGSGLKGDDKATANTRWTIIKEADRILQTESIQATTAADLDRLVNLKRRINHISSDGKMTADNDAFLINQLRMEFYERTRNQAGYRTLALAVGKRFMAMSVDSLRALDAYSAEQAKIPAKPGVTTQSQQGFYSGHVANELHKLTTAYLSVMTNPSDLEQALAWSERATLLLPAWPFLDAQTRVLHRLGRKNEAIAKQQELIARVKATGENPADYEKTLTTFGH